MFSEHPSGQLPRQRRLTLDQRVPLQVRVGGGLGEDAGQHEASQRVVFGLRHLQHLVGSLLSDGHKLGFNMLPGGLLRG